MEVDLIFDHNCNIRVRRRTARRRPLHRGQRHLQGPSSSKHARTQPQQDAMDAIKFFRYSVAIVRQSSRSGVTEDDIWWTGPFLQAGGVPGRGLAGSLAGRAGRHAKEGAGSRWHPPTLTQVN